MAIKSDNTVKTKFGQLVADGAYGLLEWFDVQRGTPRISIPNGAPFDVEQVFPEYNFSNCHNPGDDDIWICEVQM